MCRAHFLAACIGLLLSWNYHGLSVATEPGFLDFDNLPETNFSCEGKVIGGYYADTETGCQMFHVCTIGQKGEVTDIKFLCLNGTVFDQETRVCERLDEVDCSKSESFYDLNLELYGNNAAGFGIQPESEDIPDNLCEEEDEEECKTEKPQAQVKPSPTEQVQPSSGERDEDTTTQPPLSSSTTSHRPVTSTSFPSTSPAPPQILQFPSSSPETIAALLALHNAFTQSLQQHSNGKDKFNAPKITGFVESLNPVKATQEAETFEIKGGQTFSSRVPTPFPPKTQTQYNVPHSSSKTQSQFQNQPKLQFQNPPKPQFTNPIKPQFQSLPKTNYQSPIKPQFQSQPKPPAPITHPPVTFSKPIHTTSERFGNIPFRHSYHINSQVTHFHEPNYQDQYSDHESQPSSQPQTEAPKQYDFADYEDDYYDEKPHSSTITPYLLHQLKVNQVQSANQVKVSESSNHGSFVREVSSPPTKTFNVPSYRSVTTPGIAIITATSTTSSSSVKTGKPLQSAIQPFKKNPTVSSFSDSLLHSSNSNDTGHFLDGPQSYDDYKEGDVRSDPFYKDVPKISRNKRNIIIELGKPNSVAIDKISSRKLRGNILNSMFKLNSEDVLRAILNEYCSNNVNSSDSVLSFCVNDFLNSKISDKRLGDAWKIVIPRENKDFLYLVKQIASSNNILNSTSNILLLVNFPNEFKLLRDNLLQNSENKEDPNKLLNDIEMNFVNSSIHHRFKRVKRSLLNKSEKALRWKKLIEKNKTYGLKVKRVKRQTQESQSNENIGSPTSIPQENYRRRQVVRGRESTGVGNQQRSRKVVRKRPSIVENSDVAEPQQNQRRPSQRRQHAPNAEAVQPVLPIKSIQNENNAQEQFQISRPSSQRRRPISLPQPVSQTAVQERINEEENYPQARVPNSLSERRLPVSHPQLFPHDDFPIQGTERSIPQKDSDSSKLLSNDHPHVNDDKILVRPSAARRKQGARYHFCEGPRCLKDGETAESPEDDIEVSTTYPFNLKPDPNFTCDGKIKGGYYADVQAECYGYFICSQGAINGPLLKSHFWCGPTTKFNQRSRTCQAEANVACSVSHRYFHLNKDILSLPDPDDLVRDSFEPSKVKS